MKKRDIWIIMSVLAIAIIGFVFINMNYDEQPEKILVVHAGGEIYKEVPLTPDTNIKFNVETDLGLNKIEVKDGTVRVYEADCPDQICVHNMPIDEEGEIIVCLPNQVIVEIISAK